MATKRRILEILMHVSAAASIVFAFVLFDMGAQALDLPESQRDTMFASLLSLGLAFLALMTEVIALALRRSRA